MLSELRLRGLGVIAEAVVPLGSGFTVITGETGAGKTMLLQALGLVTGTKVDAGAVRRDSPRAVVEARVLVPPGSAAQSRAAAAGGEAEDDGALVAVRTLSAEGRTRAVLGGVSVPASVLADVVGGLVAIHGQHDQQRLLRPAQQRLTLDRFAGPEVAALLQSYEALWGAWLASRAQLHELRADEGERRREIDLLTHGLDRVAAAAPEPGEDEVLRSQADVLGNAEALGRAARQAIELLVGDDEVTVAHLTARVRRALDEVAGYDTGVRDWAARAREIAVLVTELGADIATRIADFEDDPGRLQRVGERRGALQELARIYTDDATGPGADGLIAWEARAVARLSELEGSGSTAEHLEAEVGRLAGSLAEAAVGLRAAREKAAAQFGEQVGEELRGLGMPHARLLVAVSPLTSATEVLCVEGADVPAGPRGIDEVELQIVAHPGADPGPLSRVASGGELSRVMLAIEVVFAGADDTSTLVFDEVDAGVGGRAAIEVGRRLARLARSHQVLVVTHLPQVAAYADHHLVVSKDTAGEVTTSGVTVVAGDARRAELARMLAGDDSSGSANAAAQELLDRARIEAIGVP